MTGARLRNVRRTPYTSLVVSEGGPGDHRAVMAEGPVEIHEDGVNPPEWAVAMIELRPERLFSYDDSLASG